MCKIARLSRAESSARARVGIGGRVRWVEDTFVEAGERRVLIATAGPYLLTVVERDDGSAHWSCGEGSDGVIGEHEGEAADVEAGQQAAIADARQRWRETGRSLAELEAE